MKKKILLVFGTRPEAIKMAPLVKELQQYPSLFKVKVCVTAQHRQMLDQVLRFFEIVPEYDLDVMHPNQDLFDVTARVLLGLRDVLKAWRPDLILVHGDTTTSMVAALAAFYLNIRVGHVESGLRTYNMQSPWPEEMNRQFTDRITDYYFAPTECSKRNLLREQVDEAKIAVTGNTVIDALMYAVHKIDNCRETQTEIQSLLMSAGYAVTDRPFILVTGHRRENLGSGFVSICGALKEISSLYPHLDIVYPVHLNPKVQELVYGILQNIPNIYLIAPQDYLPFVYLMKCATLILTDSGGVQEEAPSLGKPVLVMRNTTERPEAVEAGTVKLVGTDASRIIEGVKRLLEGKDAYDKMATVINPYGDGLASRRIMEFILEHICTERASVGLNT